MAKVTLLPILNLALLLVTVPQLTNAANDWSKPCFGGACSYDLPTSSDGPSGTLKIWGADTAITDITTAAGWEILGCDPKALEQDIRIVCRGGSDDGACAHLFAAPSGSGTVVNARAVANSTSSAVPQPAASAPDGVAALPSDEKEQGAVGKIVRLPENCGKQPFARIARAWIPEDQSIPSNIVKRLARRVDTPSGKPVVKAVRLDVNFGAADISKTGPVNFALVGANVPGAAATGDLDPSNLTPPSADSTASAAVRRSRIYRPRFDLDKSQALKPIDVNKAVTLLDKSLTCGAEGKNVEARVNIGAEAKAHAVITVGVTASGSVFPPKIESFGITSSMTADLDGAITISAGVGGTLDSGKIKIFEVGIPGLDFPGVLSIGPTFEVNGQATATLDLDVDMRVGLSYHIEKAEFTFPKGGKKSGTFSPKDTPLKLTAQPSGSATGSVEAHIIPSLNLGIDALAGTVGAGVFVELDASASMTLTLEATGAEKSATINPRGLDASPSEKLSKATQAQGRPAAGSRVTKLPRGTGVIGEHYFTQRAPQPFGFGDIVDGVKGAASTVKDKVSSAASTVKDKVSSAASTVKNKVSSAASTVKNKVTGAATAVKDKVKSAAKTLTGNNDKPAAKPAATSTKTAAKPKTTAKPKAKPTASTKPATSTKSTAAAAASSTKAKAKTAPPPASKDASFGGCFEVGAALDVSVGADADFFGLFNPETSLSLFSKKFQLFKKCFGDAQARRSVDVSPARSLSNLEARATNLKCNAESAGEPTEVANETVAAARIA